MTTKLCLSFELAAQLSRFSSGIPTTMRSNAFNIARCTNISPLNLAQPTVTPANVRQRSARKKTADALPGYGKNCPAALDEQTAQ